MISKCVKFILYILFFCILLKSVGGTEQITVSSEYHLKAAFLYNFAKFVQWPSEAFENSHTPIIFCIYGLDPFKDAIASIENKLISKRKLIIRKIGQDIEKLKECHIVFVSLSNKSKNLSDILYRIKESPILTVSDIKGFTDEGGIIGLIKKDNKIRFEVNLDAADKSHLKINSHLLRLAIDVKKGGNQ